MHTKCRQKQDISLSPKLGAEQLLLPDFIRNKVFPSVGKTRNFPLSSSLWRSLGNVPYPLKGVSFFFDAGGVWKSNGNKIKKGKFFKKKKQKKKHFFLQGTHNSTKIIKTISWNVFNNDWNWSCIYQDNEWNSYF